MKEGNQEWILVAVGSWLIAAPFLLGYAGTEIAKHGDAGAGLVMVLGALIWVFSKWAWH
ncbi:MAG: hypothetical protein LV473_23320 [Nitrospira sp.]|nr:hypothetical protein [Nitrospira sp.]